MEPRILIALDPGMSRQSAVRAVMSVRGGATGVVEALFVEDVRLLRVAELAVAREVTLEAEERAVAPASVERQLRVLATRLRADLEVAAGQAGLQFNFRVTRGDLSAELLHAASLADILVLGHSRSAVGRPFPQQLPLAELLDKGPSLLVFVQQQWMSGRRVVVLCNDDEAENALQVAAAIARHEGIDLVMLSGSEFATNAKASGGSVRRRAITGIDPEALARACVNEDARVLVLPAGVAARSAALMSELLRRVSCSLITVR